MRVPFRDRYDAGRVLAAKLSAYADRPDALVLALPRGGVPVAFEVARALHAPMDVFLVRKLGVPGQEELAMGALASGGVRVLNRDLVEALGIPERVIEAVAAREQQELARRERLYRGGRPPPDGRGRTVILPLMTALKVSLYRALRDAGISRAELMRRLGWNRESVDRLFRLDHASRLDQLEAAFKALGRRIDASIEKAA